MWTMKERRRSDEDTYTLEARGSLAKEPALAQAPPLARKSVASGLGEGVARTQGCC